MLTRREFGLASAALAAGSKPIKEPLGVVVGRRIAAHRRRLGLTIEQACERANSFREAEWEPTAMPNDWPGYETGEIDVPVTVALRMADSFGITFDELLGL
jgi:hypothetical protein